MHGRLSLQSVRLFSLASRNENVSCFNMHLQQTQSRFCKAGILICSTDLPIFPLASKVDGGCPGSFFESTGECAMVKKSADLRYRGYGLFCLK